MTKSNVVEFPTNRTENQEVPAQEETKKETQRATQLFGAFDQLNAIRKVKEEIQQQKAEMLGDSDVANKLNELISGLSPEELHELSDDAVNEIYMNDGKEIELALPFDSEERAQAFKRDFLIFLRESEVATAQIDEEMEKLEKEMLEGEAELKELIAEFGDLSTFMRTKLQDEYDKAEGTRKDKLLQIIASYDDAYTLDRVYDHYVKYGVETTISDYYHRHESVYERYMNVIAKLNFRTDLTNFNQLEARLLKPEFNKYPNMFLFAVIKMYSYKKDANKDTDGIFLSQLAVNLKSFYADGFASAEKKETFQRGIERVLTLFINDESESTEDTKEN